MYKDFRYCNKHGHDWAIKDEDLFMIKICLRCGAKMAFFPEVVAYEPNMDANGSEIHKQA